MFFSFVYILNVKIKIHLHILGRFIVIITLLQCVFCSGKVFVHLTNLKSFYRGLKYLKIVVYLFQFIKNVKNTIQSFFLMHNSSFCQERCINNFNLNAVKWYDLYTWPLNLAFNFSLKMLNYNRKHFETP